MWPHLYLFCYLQLKTSFCTQISFNSIFTIKTAVCKCFASVVIQAWSCVFLVSICVELRIRRISEITVECEVATPCTGQPVYSNAKQCWRTDSHCGFTAKWKQPYHFSDLLFTESMFMYHLNAHKGNSQTNKKIINIFYSKYVGCAGRF